MEYHIGIFVKAYIRNDQFAFFVISCDKESNLPCFYGQTLKITSESTDFLSKFRQGSLVFFNSNDRIISDICDISSILEYDQLTLNDSKFSFNGYVMHVFFENRGVIIQNKGEILIYKGLKRKYLLDSIYSNLGLITADKIRNTIEEEERYVASLDISDIISNLSIHHVVRASCRTDKEDSLYVGIARSNTKYEYKLDNYLKQYLKLNENITLFQDKGWFNADEEAEDIVNDNPIDEDRIKSELLSNYSPQKHVDYRIQERLNPIKSKASLLYSLTANDEINYMLTSNFISHYENDTKIEELFYVWNKFDFSKTLDQFNLWIENRYKKHVAWNF